MSLHDMMGSGRYTTDKAPLYIGIYDQLFAPIRYSTKTVLEIGVARGGSLELWRNYFLRAHVIGVDIELPRMSNTERITLIRADECSDSDWANVTEQLAKGARWDRSLACLPLDIVIDDALHVAAAMETSFRCLFPQVRSGGYYIIEDWGVLCFPGSPLPFMQELVALCGHGSDVASVSFYSGVGRGNGHLAVIKKR